MGPGSVKIEDIVKALQGKKLVSIDLAEVVDPILWGIVKGRPFKALYPYSRKSVIEMWKNAANALCKSLGSVTGAITFGYQDFVCRANVEVAGTPILWLTLAKSIGTNKVRTIMSKLIDIMLKQGERLDVINLLILLPEFTRGLIAGQTIQVSLTSLRRPVTVNLRARHLSIDELISLAYKGNRDLPVDSNIAEFVYSELLEELKSERSWRSS